MDDATVVLDTPGGKRSYSHQLVRPLVDGCACTRFAWHGGDRESLFAATYIRLFKSDGTPIVQGRLAPGTRPLVRGDRRIEFELALSDVAAQE